MALTASSRIPLANASFVQAFDNNRATWEALANETLRFIYLHNNEPRADDVAPILALTLESNPAFRQVMSDKKQKAKRWYRDFADLIVDRLWGGAIPTPPTAQQGGTP